MDKNEHSLQECLNLLARKEQLSAEIKEMETELVGLRASTNHLQHTAHEARVTIACLCYQMSRLFDIVGRLADNQQEDLAHKIDDFTKEFHF